MGGVVSLAPMWDYNIEREREVYRLFCEALLSKTKNNGPDFTFGYESVRGGMCRKVCEKIL